MAKKGVTTRTDLGTIGTEGRVYSQEAGEWIDVDSQVELDKAMSLSRDLKKEIRSIDHISTNEMKFLVQEFYQFQDIRKSAENQIRSIQQGFDTGATTTVKTLDYVSKNAQITENGIKNIIQTICESDEVGRWLMSTKYIGPVLAGGCLAYFDVTNKQYASQFISYAGLNDNNRPWLGREKSKVIVENIIGNSKEITDDMITEISVQTQWNFAYLQSKAYNEEKGKWSKEALINACAKIPYNKDLKVLVWKIASSFQWGCNDPESVYGRLFSERRILETAKNEKGDYADQAAKKLETTNIGKDTDAYKAYSQGMLPKKHIENRAKRWVSKIFVSHLFEEMYRVKNDAIPPRYYSLEHCEGHHDIIAPEVPFTKVTGE